MTLRARLCELHSTGGLDFPLPAYGNSAGRHRLLVEVARKDITLARLVEAHADAIAILGEAGRLPVAGALYGVWAAETEPGILLECSNGRSLLSGVKMFCSGAGIIDRALVTAGAPDSRLVDVDLRSTSDSVLVDFSAWKTNALAETQTATVTFAKTPVPSEAIVGGIGWYIERTGFWHGACGPAACWAGGAIGLVECALSQSRNDPHTMSHLGALAAQMWALRAYLDCAGDEMDLWPNDRNAAQIRALTVRHLVEQACIDVLHRFARAYGPRMLAYDAEISKRFHELELYIRQCHGERDLETLGRSVHLRDRLS